MEAVNKLSPESRAQLEAVKQRLQLATQHSQGKAPSTPANDNAGGNAAMRSLMHGQNKQAPALSPTDMNQGRTVLQGPAQGVEAKTPTKAPETPKVQVEAPRRANGIGR